MSKCQRPALLLERLAWGWGELLGEKKWKKDRCYFIRMNRLGSEGESGQAVNSKGNQGAGGLTAAVLIAVRPQISPSSWPHCQKEEERVWMPPP